LANSLTAKTISFLNMKGGVGKTTLAVNIAGALAKLQGFKVLLVDLDPQYNATQYLVNLDYHPEYVNGDEPTVLDIMGGVMNVPSVIDGTKIVKTKNITLSEVTRNIFHSWDNKAVLDLIPGTLHLINLEMAPRGYEHKLQNFINKISDQYDYIFIDCPPTFSVFLLSGFLASDYYVVPLKPDPLSSLGIPLLERVIDAYSELYEKVVQPLGIIFTMVRDTNEMFRVQYGIKDTSAGKRYIFKNSLSMGTGVAEASRKNSFLFDYERALKQGDEIKSITKELLGLLKIDR
jgi:chromosome partitioning protein